MVHDIGGPIGFEVAAKMPERIKSLTLLNTLIEVEHFRRPWMMEPFARATPTVELDAYVDLLKRVDGGRALLKIMRGFERTSAKQRLYMGVVKDVPYPVQVLWGAEDPALKLAVHGEQARRAAGVASIHMVPAKHFLQEDQAPAIAEQIAAIAHS